MRFSARARRFLAHLTNDRHAWLALLLTLPAMLPLFAPGYFFNAHDARHSVFFLVEFDRTFRAGAIWPIWGPDLAVGFGYPLWLVYAPLPYFAGQGFHLLGLGFVAATKATWALGFILGALGMYRLARRWWGPAAGLVASVAFTYAPYHLVQIYVRAALAEFMALAWLPWVVLALVALWDAPGPRRAALAALAVAALLLLHTVSMLTFVPLIAGLMLVLWLRDVRQQTLRVHPRSSAPHLQADSKDAHVAREVMPHEKQTNWTGGFSRLDCRRQKPTKASILEPQRPIFRADVHAAPVATAEENGRTPQLAAGLRAGASPDVRILRAGAHPHSRPRWLTAVAWTAAAAALGGLLASIFLIPMLFERGYIVESQWVSATYNYRNHFIYPQQFIDPSWGFGYSVPGPDDGMSFQLGLAILPLAALGAVVAVRSRRSAALPHRIEALFLVFAGTVALFMMTPAAIALWDVLPLVEMIQFPWRLLAIQVFTLALLAGLAAHWLEQRTRAGRSRSTVVGGLVLAISVASLPYVQAQIVPTRLQDESPVAVIEFETKFSDMRGVTRWSERIPRDEDSPLIAQYLAGEEIRRAAIVGGQGNIIEQEAGALQARATVHAETLVRLRFYTYYFPGWRATVNGQPVEVTPDPPNGLIGLDLPAGEHRVEVRFGATPVRTLAAGLSALGLIIVLALALWRRSLCLVLVRSRSNL